MTNILTDAEIEVADKRQSFRNIAEEQRALSTIKALRAALEPFANYGVLTKAMGKSPIERLVVDGLCFSHDSLWEASKLLTQMKGTL